jgi:hypothetical protein
LIYVCHASNPYGSGCLKNKQINTEDVEDEEGENEMVEIVASPEYPREVIEHFQSLGLPSSASINAGEWDAKDGRHAIYNGAFQSMDINWNGQKAVLPMGHIAYFSGAPKNGV